MNAIKRRVDAIRSNLRELRRGGTRIQARCFFEPRDLWRGVFWRFDLTPMEDENGYMYAYQNRSHTRLDLYICFLPICVVKIQFIARSQGDWTRVDRRPS